MPACECGRRWQVSLLAIRERELKLYTQNCRAIGTQAALLAGFAYGGCCLGSYLFPEESSDSMRAAYLVAMTWAMGLNVYCLFSSTLCTMLGPGLALRGPDGSMEQAVEGLAIEYRFTFVVYVIGLLMFFAGAPPLRLLASGEPQSPAANIAACARQRRAEKPRPTWRATAQAQRSSSS